MMLNWKTILAEMCEEYHWTQEELAAQMRLVGFPWERKTVIDIKCHGRRVSAEEYLGLLSCGLDPLVVGWKPGKPLESKVPPQVEVKAVWGLGWSFQKLRRRAKAIWGRSLEAERERRIQITLGVDAGASQQVKGHITRQLLKELKG